MASRERKDHQPERVIRPLKPREAPARAPEKSPAEKPRRVKTPA